MIIILHEYNDGWVLARNESANGVVGLLPKNFLVPITTSNLSSDNLALKQVKSPLNQFSNDAQEKRMDLLRASKRYSLAPAPFPMQIVMDSASTDVVASVEKEKPVSLLEATDKLASVTEGYKSRMLEPSHIGAFKLAIAGDSGIGKVITCFLSHF